MVCVFFIASVFSLLSSTIHGQNTGQSTCDKLNRNAKWICKKITDCTYAQQLLSDKGGATTCGYEKHVRKICCPQPRPTTKPQRSTPSTTATSSPVVTRINDPVDVVRRKCIDYSQYRYTNETEIPLVLGQKPYIKSVLDCKSYDSLIVGGIAVDQKEYPHMALLGYRDVSIDKIEWLCGGTLISEQYVLTAAHCTVSNVSGPVKWIAMGLLFREQINSAKINENVFVVEKWSNHPNYKAPSQYNDIALIKLRNAVTFTAYIRPICLFSWNEIPTNLHSEVTISGWGLTHASEASSEQLLKAKINYFPGGAPCNQVYTSSPIMKQGYDPKSMICAGDTTTGKDTCQGDSGGPLQVSIPGYPCMYSQVGITSVGAPMCGDKTPAIYTKIVNYLPWIQRIVWP